MNRMLLGLAGTIALSAPASPVVEAATLSPAVAVVVASCNPTQDMQSGAGPVSAGCHDAGDFSGGLVEYTASADVVGLPWPGATVSAAARSDNTQYGEWLGYGQATLSGAVAITETGTAPFTPAFIPMIWQATGSANLDGEDVQAEGWSQLLPLTGLGHVVQMDGMTPAFSEAVLFDALPGFEAEFTIYAFCGAGVEGEGFSTCDASMTGRLLFDQQAFDQRYGADAYALDEFFRIEYSSGLTPVPLPATWTSLGLALLSLLVRRGRTTTAA